MTEPTPPRIELTPTDGLSVRIENHGDEPLYGFAVCWHGLSPDDGSESRGYSLVLDTLQYRPVLPPHSSQLVSLLDPPRSTRSIELDSILTANFTVIGPDRSRLLLRLRAAANAQRDLLTAVATQAHSSSALQSWLETVQAEARAGARARRPDSPYFNLYCGNRLSTAAHLLGLLHFGGLPAVLASAARELASQKFPPALLDPDPAVS